MPRATRRLLLVCGSCSAHCCRATAGARLSCETERLTPSLEGRIDVRTAVSRLPARPRSALGRQNRRLVLRRLSEQGTGAARRGRCGAGCQAIGLRGRGLDQRPLGPRAGVLAVAIILGLVLMGRAATPSTRGRRTAGPDAASSIVTSRTPITRARR